MVAWRRRYHIWRRRGDLGKGRTGNSTGAGMVMRKRAERGGYVAIEGNSQKPDRRPGGFRLSILNPSAKNL